MLQFHEGLGFLTSHALLTNTFEASLQLVNPKLTVPYWDFTIEKSSLGGNTADKNEPQMDSPIFTESWFGGFDTEDFMVSLLFLMQFFFFRCVSESRRKVSMSRLQFACWWSCGRLTPGVPVLAGLVSFRGC